MKKYGEWILIHPTDCFTMFPVYECSICDYIESGYTPRCCPHCGARNTIAKNKFITRALFAPANPMAVDKRG